MKTVEVYIAMNEDGYIEAGCDEEIASERLHEDQGGVMIRIVRIKVTMSPPAITETDVTVADEASQTIKVEASDDE